MRKIGLHIRLTTTLTDLLKKALRLNIDFFQCFLVTKTTGKLFKCAPGDIKNFVNNFKKHFDFSYIHGSYWINPAHVTPIKHYALKRELEYAKYLGLTHMVLHPGSAKGGRSKADGIDAVVRFLNTAMQNEHEITFVLENVAYGHMSVGGDIDDFYQILQKTEYPERLKFCIDTAHAYAYGYNIKENKGRESFINELEKSIGLERIALLHVNDAQKDLGAQHDIHAVLGEGTLGFEALKRFVLHEKLKNIPMLLELPVMHEDQERAILQIVRSWHM